MFYNEDFLWTEKYRPKTVGDTILPLSLKKVFQQFVDQKNIPNLLLTGIAGVGKTSIAKAMLEELGCDYIVINGSMNGNIDTLRNDIRQFASSISLQGGRKYVILDEADYLNCLWEEEEILLSDNTKIKLKDMEFDKEYNVLSFNVETQKLENDIATLVNETSKEVFEIELEDGRKLYCTNDHPICCLDDHGNIHYRSLKEGLENMFVLGLK